MIVRKLYLSKMTELQDKERIIQAFRQKRQVILGVSEWLQFFNT